MRRSWGVLLALAFFLLAGGCGYRFTGEGAGPLPGLKRIAIPVFENSTSEAELGSLFAGALRKEFIRKGSLEVVPVEQAEAIFRGRIKDIYTTAVAHGDIERQLQTNLTLESRLYLTLDIRCEDPKTGNVIWQDQNFTYHKVYRQVQDLKNPDPIFGYDNRRRALEFLAQEMSIRVHDRFLSSF